MSESVRFWLGRYWAFLAAERRRQMAKAAEQERVIEMHLRGVNRTPSTDTEPTT